MDRTAQNWVALIGRIALALIFILSGVGKLEALTATESVMTSHGIPAAPLLIWPIIAVELLGGLALAVGWKARWAAAILALFIVPATLIFHAFWAADPAQAMDQQIHFLKNVSIFGGVLTVAAFGPAGYSVDAWLRRMGHTPRIALQRH